MVGDKVEIGNECTDEEEQDKRKAAAVENAMQGLVGVVTHTAGCTPNVFIVHILFIARSRLLLGAAPE